MEGAPQRHQVHHRAQLLIPFCLEAPDVVNSCILRVCLIRHNERHNRSRFGRAGRSK
jgi:hypothetical protein